MSDENNDKLGKAYSMMEEVFDLQIGQTVVFKCDYDEVDSMLETHLRPSFRTMTIAERMIQQCHGGEQFQYKLIGDLHWYPAMALKSWDEFKELLIRNRTEIEMQNAAQVADLLVMITELQADMAKVKAAQEKSE